MRKDMFRPVKDTYESTRSAIARVILNNPVSAYIGRPEEPINVRQADLRLLAEPDHDPELRLYSLEFRKAGTNCVLYVNLDADFDEGVKRDEAGSDYNRYLLNCKVTWPSHGSMGASFCLSALAFYQQVALLAAEIECTVTDPIWRFLQTKAEREENDAKALKEKVRLAAVSVIDNARKNMRVGSTVDVNLIERGEITAGWYEHTFADNKTYRLVVEAQNEGTVGQVIRLS